MHRICATEIRRLDQALDVAFHMHLIDLFDSRMWNSMSKPGPSQINSVRGFCVVGGTSNKRLKTPSLNCLSLLISLVTFRSCQESSPMTRGGDG